MKKKTAKNVPNETMRPCDLAPLNSYELASLKSLTAYVGHETGLTDLSIEKVLSRRFGAENYRGLQSRYFDKIISVLATGEGIDLHIANRLPV